ncbi:trehalose 6-phosphate synthase [Nematocida displodere]|uniref:Trehalose 6-phosphate synthase n=1 Tax=Nematocida displodere TaxID=1805483 RepID=A0A177ECT5_9MICR|nr:trehalose 6-phosphate synthase [Nematocida displodere]
MEEKGRILVVSNRLPLKVKKEAGKYVYTPTSGGLVTGLNCAQETLNFLWVGSLENVPAEEREEVRKNCIETFKFYPIFVEDEMYSKYYNNMCNGVLWPLLHSFSDLISYDIADYIAYKRVNEQFAAAILEMAQENDLIWVHDYHLMLLPEMLRQKTKLPIKIGFFLHIPFPDVFIVSGFALLLPLLKGVLGADLASFHTFEYVSNFKNACNLFDSTLASPFAAKMNGRTTRVEANPIGIDPAIFARECLKDVTKERVAALKKRFRGKKIILGIDRVDYIKGIPHRLKAFDRLMKTREDLSDSVVFCQVGVPSRTDIPVYQALSDTLCRLSGFLNAEGNIDETNVYFINNSVSFTELCALYMASDVCVISSLRDGMNLVSLEFIACAGPGALIMSDYAGATGMLVGSICANPWSIEDLASSYEKALEMPEEERIRRKMNMQAVTSEFSAMRWGERFIRELSEPSE